MRNVLIAVVCVLLAVVGGVAWHALRAPGHVLQADETRELATADVEQARAPVLERAQLPAPDERAPAGAMPGSIMTFHVIDARSRQPIERFDLQVRSATEESESRAPAKSSAFAHNAGGRVRALCQPRSTVTVVAPGFATVRADVHADSHEADVQTIAMDRAGGIEGTVMFEGEPAVAVRIFALRDATTLTEGQIRQSRRLFLSEAESDGSGRFLVTGLNAGSYALRFEALGAADLIKRHIEVPPETTVDIGEIILRREAIVRGSIIPPVDQSPSVITVLLDGVAHEGTPPPTLDFEFRGLAAGKHFLSWTRRDGGNTSTAPESRLVQFELQPGEVRDMIVDATGGTTSRLTLHVRANGAPAVRRFVRASPDLEKASQFSSWTAQSTTDASGVAVLQLRPGQRVRVDVFNDALQALGGLPEPIELADGEERELTLDLVLGTLLVVLPSNIEIPAQGRVVLELRDALGKTFSESASTLLGGVGTPRRSVWSSNRIEFGPFPAGAYTARVRVERIEAVTSGQASRLPFEGQPIRAPFESRVDVAAFLETVLTVPN